MLRPHPAADGALVRVRLIGGTLTAPQLEALADLTGEADLELTSRGNLQVRGVVDIDDARARLAEAGLLPSATHERVRNIVASTRSAAARAAASDLDQALRGSDALAGLPGRFLFAIDDGAADVASLGADVETRAGRLHLDGHPTDLPGTVAHLLAAAEAFVDLRTDEWRLRDLADGPRRIARALHGTVAGDRDVPAPPAPPVGWFDEPDGTVTLGGGVPLGRLAPRLARFVAAVDRPITITPWRTLLIRDLDEGTAETVVRVLAPMGLIFDAASPALRVSACVGDRGCARAEGDSLTHAAGLVDGVGPDERVHVVACGRGCGAPSGEHRLVIVPRPDPGATPT